MFVDTVGSVFVQGGEGEGEGDGDGEGEGEGEGDGEGVWSPVLQRAPV